MSLGERIREEREWLGATRELVAGKLGIMPADVEAWEAGEVEPTDVQVGLLARLFGLSMDRLRGAPLVVDPDLGHRLGTKNLTHKDCYEVARFAEYLRHAHQEATP